MYIKQVSVFVENRPGKMAAVLEVLANNDINIEALSIADTSDFGVLRLIVTNPEKAKQVLNAEGVIVKMTDVLAIPMPDEPGSLAKLMSIINDGMLAIEYMYAFTAKKDNEAVVVIKVNEPEKALELLKKSGKI